MANMTKTTVKIEDIEVLDASGKTTIFQIDKDIIKEML